MLGSIISSALGGLGGILSGNSQKDAYEQAAAGAQWRPFGIKSSAGDISFDGNNMSMGRSGEQGAFARAFGGNALGVLGGGASNQGLIDFTNSFANGEIQNAYGAANQAGSALPFNSLNEFNSYLNANAAYGRGAGQDFNALAAMYGGAQGGPNEGTAQQLFGFGANALNNSDFSSVARDQIARARAQARPGEERAVNSKFQNLFNRGALSSTGGERQIGELALSQELADIQRVQGAENFAQGLTQMNRNFGLGAIGAGLGARQQDTMANLNRANMFGNMGQNLMNFGQNAAGQRFGANVDFSNLVNSRGQQRLANATGLLGFGQNAEMQNWQRALQGFGVTTQINSDLRNLAALSGNLSSGQANAGANAGRFTAETGFSPFGSFLQGMGSGVGSTDWGKGGAWTGWGGS